MALKNKFSRTCGPLWFFIGLGVLSALVPAAFAHDFWIEPSGGEFILTFGHGQQREEFDPSRVKSVKAFSHEGREIDIRRFKKEKGLLLQPAQPPSWIHAEIDNGYWSKTIYGWKNLPKRKASRVVEAHRSYNYSKLLITWNPALQGPVKGARLDIALLKNPWELKAGAAVPVQVFLNGKPIAGVEIEGLEHKIIGATDQAGRADIRLSRGRHLLSVSYKEPVKDDPDADYLNCTATLTFEVEK